MAGFSILVGALHLRHSGINSAPPEGNALALLAR
jgi:hypothetical protein